MKLLSSISSLVLLVISASQAGSQEALAQPSSSSSRGVEFETPEYFANYGLGHINASSAYAAGWTGAGTIIAVIDAGFQATHPDLAPNIIEQINTSGVLQLDHGTKVAGLAAATKNDLGMHGVAFDAKLALYTFGTFAGETAAFNAAADIGATAISNSYGIDVDVNNVLNNGAFATDPYQALSSTFGVGGSAAQWQELVAAMRRSQENGVIVWAAANVHLADMDISAGLPLVLPELQNSWLAVVNVNQANQLQSVHCGSAAAFCLAAPGFGTYSTAPGGGYGTFGGTSAATPHVSGAVAIARQMFPGAGSDQLAALVLQTATDLGPAGVDDTFGWGLLNLANIAATLDTETASIFAEAAWSRFAALRHVQSAVAVRSGSAGVWASAIHGGAAFDGAEQSSPGAWSATTGLLVGADLWDSAQWRAGVAAGFTRTGTHGSNSAEANGYHLAGYADWAENNWFGRIVGQLAHFDQMHTRYDISGAANTSVTPVGMSSSDAMAARLDARFGHSFELYGQSLEPYLAAAGQWQVAGGFGETGAGIFSLDVPGNGLHQFDLGPGLRWVSAPVNAQNFEARLVVDVAYARVFGDTSHRTATGLLGTEIVGRTTELGRDSLRLGTRLETESRSGMFSASIAYDGVLQTNASSHAVSATFKNRF